MMTYHPLYINWQNRKITVIGAGKIAERKILSFLYTGAQITVISPTITNRLKDLANQHQIYWKQKHYQVTDVCHTFFLIAATNNAQLNKQIIKDCSDVPLTLNVSDHTTSNSMMPAIIPLKHFQLTISSFGKNPQATKQFKKTITPILGRLEEK